jgi:hypothetical protein
MGNQMIPGHARAYTWSLLIAGLVAANLSRLSEPASIGIVLVVSGAFLGDQATHLNQHHDDVPPTWTERLLQKKPLLFQAIGVASFGLGIWILRQ